VLKRDVKLQLTNFNKVLRGTTTGIHVQKATSQGQFELYFSAVIFHDGRKDIWPLEAEL